MTGVPVGHLVVGPAQHGVVRFAELLVGHTPGRPPALRVASAPARGELEVLRGCRTVHLQYTDALYAPRCEDAAQVFTELVDTVRTELDARCSVTLHDLPQSGDGAGLHPRRVAVYRAVVEAVDAVVVSSEHEATLVDELGASSRRRAVIPLPVDPLPRVDRPLAGDGQVTVLGFVHPGKGHDDALTALPGLEPQVGLTVLGRAAPGHDDLLDALATRADAQGRPCVVTGFVPEGDLAARLWAAGVPLAPHRAVSASGSIMTWLGAGRRPLVPEGPYARELERRCPGAVLSYPRAGLHAALARALHRPELTWLDPGVQLSPTPNQVALTYAAFLRS